MRWWQRPSSNAKTMMYHRRRWILVRPETQLRGSPYDKGRYDYMWLRWMRDDPRLVWC